MNNVLYDSPALTNAAVVYNMGFIRAPISDNEKSLSMNVSTLDGSTSSHLHLHLFVPKKLLFFGLRETMKILNAPMIYSDSCSKNFNH